jgi:NADPH:quinone reductase
MRAMTVTAFGGPEVLRETDLPDPRPGPGQVSIDTSHAAVGLVDVLLRRGDMSDNPGLPQPPFVPGGEVAGTVRELGPGVSGLRVGESVVTLPQITLGGYAAITIAQAATVIPLGNSGVDPVQAVAALPYAVTAYLALTKVAHLQHGESLLVHGAAGGLAATFPAVARSLGASRILGTVLSADRIADTAHLDYDEVFTSADFVAALSDKPVDVVADPVGGEVRTASLNVLAPLGRLLLVGHASSTPDTPITGDQLWLTSIAMLGFSVPAYLAAHQDTARPAGAYVLPLLANGQLTATAEVVPLADAAAAHRRVESRQVSGRLVLAV